MTDLGECYTLTGGAVRKGYVRVTVGRSLISAHRVAWMAVNGPIPEGGAILHHCDNRACIRASHLYLGDNDDNVRDRVMRLRSARKLTPEETIEIRGLYSRYGRNGPSGRELAIRYNISRAQVSRIVNQEVGAG